jgi:hypothetical protein
MTSTHDPLFLDDDGENTGDPILFEDNLDTTMVVPANGRFEFHANPSTRPQNDARTWVKLAENPSRTETFENVVPTVPGGGDQSQPIYYREFSFTVTPDDDRHGLKASTTLADPSPGVLNDYDIYLYRVLDSGARQYMASAATEFGNETLATENVEPGEYVLRVVNWLAEDPRYTVTFGTYGPGEVETRTRSPEAWTLTCERPNGSVSSPQKVIVDRGERVTVSGACTGKPQKQTR